MTASAKPPRAERPPSAGARSPSQAAVLVPVFHGSHGTEVVLTLRADHLPTHAGQISLPGGRFDETRDESLLATALREAAEEIGLREADADVLGALPPVATMSSAFEIHPFVARVPPGYVYEPHPGEVAAVFSMPLVALDDPTLAVAHRWTVNGAEVEVPGIRYSGHLVWGATLRILGLLARSDVLLRGFA